jgi:hypothetical protein
VFREATIGVAAATGTAAGMLPSKATVTMAAPIHVFPISAFTISSVHAV